MAHPLEGKTIAQLDETLGNVLIRFTDGTVAKVDSGGYELCEIETNPLLDDSEQVAIGLITQDEYNSRVEAKRKRGREAQEEMERLQYEILKKKFEQIS